MHEEEAAEIKFREFSKHANVSMHPQLDEMAKLKNEIEEFKAQKQHMQEMERLMNELKSLKTQKAFAYTSTPATQQRFDPIPGLKNEIANLKMQLLSQQQSHPPSGGILALRQMRGLRQPPPQPSAVHPMNRNKEVQSQFDPRGIAHQCCADNKKGSRCGWKYDPRDPNPNLRAVSSLISGKYCNGHIIACSGAEHEKRHRESLGQPNDDRHVSEPFKRYMPY